MYTAKLFVETGYGLAVRKVVFNTMKDMMMSIEKYVKAYAEKNMSVSKVVFNYPSGKTFTQKY